MNKLKHKKRLRKFRYALLSALLAAFSAALIARPEEYIERCMQGIALWAICVLPSLFPFMVVCALLTNTGIAAKASAPLRKITGIFKLPPCAAAGFVMSICSGYPTGSRTVYEFYSGGFTDAEGCKKLACLCSTSGPLFIIGAVGVKMFGDVSYGFKLFFAHAAAVIAVSLVYSLCGKKTTGKAPLVALKGDVLYESFYGAVSAALTAGAFIAFFYTAAQMAQDFYLLYPLEKFFSAFTTPEVASAVCTGLIEMTGGCSELAECRDALSLPLTGFLITFGGACVILQQLCYLLKAKADPLKFIGLKFASGALCFLILLIIC